jgi:hypothetical protein
MSGVPAWPSQKVLQYFLSVTAQLQLGCAHFFVSAMLVLLSCLTAQQANFFKFLYAARGVE